MEARNGSGIRKKGEGPGIMISAFLTEESGLLFSEAEFAEFVQRRRASRKPDPKYVSEACRGLDDGYYADTQALACFNDGYNSDLN